MKHLLNILLGFTAFASAASPNHYPDLANGFAKDQERLKNDAMQVNKQLNNEAKKVYGKQKYTS